MGSLTIKHPCAFVSHTLFRYLHMLRRDILLSVSMDIFGRSFSVLHVRVMLDLDDAGLAAPPILLSNAGNPSGGVGCTELVGRYTNTRLL